VTESKLAVPLREFADTQEVADKENEYRLKVWIDRNCEVEGTVAIIPASETVAPVYCWVGSGRYKTALAKALLRDGSGRITVNGISVIDYFKDAPDKGWNFLRRLQYLPQARDVLSRFNVQVEVWGSNPTTMRQIKAVAHALARALVRYDPKLEPVLKRAGFGGVRVKNNIQKAKGDNQ